MKPPTSRTPGDVRLSPTHRTRLQSVDELEDRVEDEPQDHVDFGNDAEFESEIDAIISCPATMEESYAIKFLPPGNKTEQP